MRTSSSTVAVAMLACSVALLLAVHAAPMNPEEEQVENVLTHSDEGEGELGQWDPINTAALRKLLLQLDNEERFARGSRSWPSEPRGWVRNTEGRIVRPWRADKRQVRFRQCYFNPISCFRK